MTTSRYIVSNPGTSGTFIDLGLNGRGLTDPSTTVREIAYVNADGATVDDRVFVRAGMTVDFTGAGTNTSGMDVVYLEGRAADYTLTQGSGTITLSRGTGLTAESVTLNVNAFTSVWFANGSATSDAINTNNDMSTVTLNATDSSVAFSGVANSGQTVRIVTLDATGETFAIARAGTVLNAAGKQGVDAVYVEAGGSVNATRLGGGQDVIYVTGNWADYTKAVSGLNVVLTRTADTNEVITVAASVGAANDLVVFADGSLASNAIRLGLNANGAAWDATADAAWDATTATTLYAPPALSNLRLVSDTGSSTTDSVTNDGTITFDLPAGADVTDTWEISIDGGANWSAATPTIANGQVTFTLAAQVTGAEGQTYAAGSVAVRQVAADGTGSTALINAAQIVVDNATSTATSVFDNVTAVSPGSTRYITLWQTVDQPINLAELKLYDQSGTWINLSALADANITTSTNLQSNTGDNAAGWLDANHRGGKLFDRSTNQTHDSNNTIHTNSGGINETYSAIFIDLGQAYDLSRIELLNRVESNGFTVDRAKDIVILTSESEMKSAFSAAAGGQTAYDAMRADVAVNSWALQVDANSYDTRAVTTNSTEFSSPNPVLTGTGEIGATVSVTVTENAGSTTVFTGTATVDSSGNWSLVTTLSPTATTSYTVSATQTDIAGNAMAAPVTSALTIDPSIPATPSLDAGSNSGVQADQTTNVTTPTITGTAAAGATVTILLGGVSQGTVTADAAGAWTYTHGSALAGGAHTFAARVDGKNSAGLTITIDTAATAPTITSTLPGAIDNTASLTISGTAEAGSTAVSVTITDAATPTAGTATKAATVTQNPDGSTTWSVTFTAAEQAGLANGDAQIVATATDRAANTNTVTGTIAGAPALPDLATADDSGANTTDNITNATTPTISGTFSTFATAFALVVDGGTPLSTSGSDGLTFDLSAGTWSFVPTAAYADGETHDFVAQATVNGAAVSSPTLSVVIDTAYVNADLAITSTLPTAIDNTVTLTISGTAEAGADSVSVTVADADGTSADAVKAATVTHNGDGTTSWSVTFDPATDADYAALVNGEGTVTVNSNDRAANAATPVSAAISSGIILSNTALDAVADLDVRSDLVLNASQSAQLVAAADAAGLTITLVNTGDATRNIVLDLTNATDRAMISFADGGTSGTIIRINPGFDLDVGASYRLEVSAGAFVDAGSGLVQSVVLDATTGITFDTVTPSAGSTAAASQMYGFTDSAADGWDQAALAAGPSWFSMVGRGDGDGLVAAASPLDFSTGDLVAYMGKITHEAAGADSFTLDNNLYGVVTGFGAGDLIYFDDQDNSAATYERYDAAELEAVLWGGTSPVGADTGNELAMAQTVGGLSYLDFTVAGHTDTFVEGIGDNGAASTTDTLQELNGGVVPVLVA